jgi:L-lysine 2,3-aminomutase
MSKYLELLNRNAEEADKANAEHKAAEAALQLKSDILECKKLSAAAKVTLERVKGTYPLDSNSYLTALVEQQNAEAQLADLESLEKELFS